MPALLADGRARAGPCEWCGKWLDEDEARPVQAGFVEPEDPGLEWAVFVTRMCQDCIHIYCRLEDDGLRER
jgi:hypothetical protein